MKTSVHLRCWIVMGGMLALILLAFGSQQPQPVHAWGSFREYFVNYNSHAQISALAWRALNKQINLNAYSGFPLLSNIIAQDARTIGLSEGSTSPDSEFSDGPVTLFSGHYAQNGPQFGQEYYQYFITGLKSRDPNNARYAAWLAHFTSDLYVPWHTLCVMYTGQTVDELYDLNFPNASPQKFLDARAAVTNGNLDCYDPSYWDGSPATNLSSTHIYWERQIADPSDESRMWFDPHWNNSLVVAARTQNFLSQVVADTSANFTNIRANGNDRIYEATRGVYTVWRASLNGLDMLLDIDSANSTWETYRVYAVVQNNDLINTVNNVRATIILPNGLWLVNPALETQTVTASLAPGEIASPVYWEVRSPAYTSGCGAIKVKLQGDWPAGVPDLNEREDQVLTPARIRILTPTSDDTVNTTKVTVTGEISESGTRAWITVNGNDTFWISENYSAGTQFSKEVELKSGANEITVHAVNSCGKESQARVNVTGNFEEVAIKAVMSWNTNGTDVDLHLTDSNGGSECYYNNSNPNWGDYGSTLDDPRLDIDNTQGYGPETIILSQPKPGQYTVRIVYYSDHNDEQAIPSFVTVKVYENDVLKGTFTNTLNDSGATWENIYTFHVTASGLQSLSAGNLEGMAFNTAIQETRLTNQAAFKGQPAIAGNQVTWIDGRHGNHQQIYRYDLAAKSESRVSSVPLDNPVVNPPLSPVILQYGQAQVGPHLYWTDNRYDAITLYRLNPTSLSEEQIEPLAHPGNSSLAADGNRVVWEDTRNGNADIYLYDTFTQQERQITNHAANQLAPDISGDTIVWTDTRQDDYTIFSYNLATSVETQLARISSGRYNPPSIDQNLVVWADSRNGNSEIYLYNLTTREETRITTHPAEQVSPKISGNRIVWVDYRTGNPDIYLYDLTSGVETAICTDPAPQLEPAIDGQNIVWVDRRDGHPEIYMAALNVWTSTKVFLPAIQYSLPQTGIHGKVTKQGAPGTGLTLKLERLDGENATVVMTTTTGADGSYLFKSVPALASGQVYYVAYYNSSSVPNPGSGSLSAWYGNAIKTYTSGDADGGSFDVVDVPASSPGSGTSIRLPYEFCWTRRGVAGDSYRLVFYNPSLNDYAFSRYLGDVGCITVNSLPSSWASGGRFQWQVGVAAGDPEANPYNYGFGYEYKDVNISW